MVGYTSPYYVIIQRKGNNENVHIRSLHWDLKNELIIYLLFPIFVKEKILLKAFSFFFAFLQIMCFSHSVNRHLLVQSEQWTHQTSLLSLTLFRCFYCQLLTYLTHYSDVSIVNFKTFPAGTD